MIPAGLLMALLFAAGTAAGSFAATAGLRGARSEPVLGGRSHCDGCGRTLSYAQTLPLVSYVAMGGACRACRSRIDLIHPAGEAAGGAVFLGALLVGDPARAIAVALLGLVLIATAAVDAKSQRLPDGLTLIVAAVCLGLAGSRGLSDVQAGLVAAVLAMAVLEGLRRWSAARRGEAGLGFGDVKLVGALALWLGILTPWMVAGAAGLGLLAVLVLKPSGGRLAFGPAIAVSAWTLGLMREAGAWPI